MPAGEATYSSFPRRKSWNLDDSYTKLKNLF